MTNENPNEETRMRFLAAQALGRIGGKSRSERKLAASNANRMKALAKLAEMRNEKRDGEQKENNMQPNIRSIDGISMLNPLSEDDVLVLKGERWKVKRGLYGWFLYRDNGSIPREPHPTIHTIDGMAEFIGAILENA